MQFNLIIIIQSTIIPVQLHMQPIKIIHNSQYQHIIFVGIPCIDMLLSKRTYYHIFIDLYAHFGPQHNWAETFYIRQLIA